MRVSFLAAVLLLCSSWSNSISACALDTYVSDDVVGSSWFQPPPKGYGVRFPWANTRTAELVGKLNWPRQFTSNIERAQKYSIKGGTASYLLVSYDPKACGFELAMYRTQGLLIGSYMIDTIKYKLYAVVSNQNTYNELLSIGRIYIVPLD